MDRAAVSVLEDELGDIVAKARVGREYTLGQLAELSGVPAGDISAVEAYRLTPSAEDLARLAQALKLDAGKLQAIAEESWVPHPVDLSTSGAIVERVAVPYGDYGSNCYVVGCPESCAAAIVDPGGATDEILKRIEEHELAPALVLVTHAHGAHIGGLRSIAKAFPGVRLVNQQAERDSVTRGVSNRWVPAKDRVRMNLGSLTIVPLATPGHTPGSTCYLIDGLCFVGDTLFAGSIGRSGSGDTYSQAVGHIRAKILSLPDETVLLPGHGPVTTVGEEKAHNPFF